MAKSPKSKDRDEDLDELKVFSDLSTLFASTLELQPTLEACNLSLREARGTLDRLVAARLIEPHDAALQS